MDWTKISQRVDTDMLRKNRETEVLADDRIAASTGVTMVEAQVQVAVDQEIAIKSGHEAVVSQAQRLCWRIWLRM